MAAIITKIRAGNQFEYVWAIERAGVAVNLTTATDIELSYGVGKPCTDYSKIPFTVVDTNKISSSHLYAVTGTYNLKLEFKIDGEQNTIDIDAFKIVPRSEDASDSSQFAVTSDMAIGFKGDKLTFADLTPSDIAELQQPANDAIASIQSVEVAVENAETTRVESEQVRNEQEESRVLQENARQQSEHTRQTNIATAISNAEYATNDAITATDSANANEQVRISNESARVIAENTRQTAKQNSLIPDGTGTKFPTVDAVNAGLGGKQATLVSGTNIKTVNGTSLLGSGDVSNLIASYTHSGNKEVYVSSIDYTTNTFTSVGHGLINSADYDKTLMLAINRNEAIYPFNVMPFNPTDIDNTVGLFVVNATPDTFQLSKTAGGAVITLINKAENDLTKWHFEHTTVKTITISGLLGKINAGVKTVIDGTIIWGYTQYIGGNSAGLAYIKSSDGATPPFNYSVIYGKNDYPVPCFGGQIIHTDIYTNNGHRKIFDIAVYGYGTALNKVDMTNKYINFVTPIVIADSSKSFVTLEGVSISNGTTIKVYSL